MYIHSKNNKEDFCYERVGRFFNVKALPGISDESKEKLKFILGWENMSKERFQNELNYGVLLLPEDFYRL